MNPAIIIPTFWSSRRSYGSSDRNAMYDQMTPIDKPGNLARCIESLRKVNGLGKIVLLVAAEAGVENQAAEKVRGIIQRFPELDVAVVSAPEVRHIHRRMEQVGLGALASCVTLSGYGAIRNLGILAASIFGNDVAVFLDENAVVTTVDFLERACYGLGAKAPSGGVVAAKAGVVLDESGNCLTAEDSRWYRRSWNKDRGYNEYIRRVMDGSRMSRANLASGECLVLHADAFGSVSFDPWITRGEDVDYVISSRMYGREVWVDNRLTVTHPNRVSTGSGVRHFQQDVFRWYYENRKLEFAKAQIDLMQIQPESLNPYPGPFLTKAVGRKALITSIMSIIGDPEHMAYWDVATKGRKEAADYARENCSRYFEFQRQWPTLVRSMWSCTPLATQLSGARNVQSGNPAFTGRFTSVSN